MLSFEFIPCTSSSFRASLPCVHFTRGCACTYCACVWNCAHAFVLLCENVNNDQYVCTCCLDRTLYCGFFLLLLLSFFSIINWITECERARSRWCVSAYMLKDCCMNACEKTGIFSFADSLRWGWGKTRGQNAQRGLGGKKIPEITTETLNSYE